MLKSINLKILENNGRSVLICDGCKEMLLYYSTDYLKRIAKERGWMYNADDDKVYCRACRERNKMKWWLISDKDMEIIREALGAPTHEAKSYNCQDWPIGSGCRGCDGDKLREKAINILDIGLHSTDVVPEDWEEEK